MSKEFLQGGDGVFAGIGPGSRVADYLLEEQIGRGGMAVVFRAVDERLDRRVALKFLAPALAVDQAFRQRFVRESRAAAHVDDPHIIPVHSAGEAGGMLFIAMRWVPGGDVRTLMSEVGSLPADQAASIVSQVASALDAAHAAGLVHRDVKPANMLLDRRPDRPDHVYLADFGLSKGTLTLSSPGISRTGEYLGTPLYTAPEQVQGHSLDGRADQYSLACAAFEMLAGEPPFQRDHPEAVLWAQVYDPPPPLSARRPDLPAAADLVLAKALAKSAKDRYATCQQFADALRAALGLSAYRAVPGLIPTIRHGPGRPEDYKRTVTVAVVLEPALPAELADALASPDDQVRLGAVQGLGEIASGSQPDVAEAAVKKLNALVMDRSKAVSAAASAALAKIADWGWPSADQADQESATVVPQVVASETADDPSSPWWEKKSERWWER